MDKFKQLFGDRKQIIAMIHLAASPGTFNYNNNVKAIINKAVKEAEIYKKSGIETVMIENMHDVPYLNKNVGHEVSTLMSIIAYEIKHKTVLKCGIQILAGANKQALAAAHSAGVDFIRAESYVFSHVADEGLMHSDAGELKRYQKQIGAEDILIFTDIKKKHSSHALTGEEANVNETELIKSKINIPVFIGSGINTENISSFYSYADAFIVGSHFKENGYWANKLDIGRIENFMRQFNTLR